MDTVTTTTRPAIIVCGGRHFRDRGLLHRTLDEIAPRLVMHGGCPSGADLLANRWAHETGTALVVVPALWNKYGRGAGPMRNALMASLGVADYLVAFAGGRGTAHMTLCARDVGMPVHEVS
jgi:hypothetical protein